MILVEADVSQEWDRRVDWASLADRSVRAAITHSRHPDLIESDAEISIKFASDEEVKSLNAEWRNKDKATNVLSFPMLDEALLDSAPCALLGDVILAHGICADEAAEAGLAVEAHAAHLVVHGTLHLLGYDHETSDADAEEMEAVERRALAAIGIADPYKMIEVQP